MKRAPVAVTVVISVVALAGCGGSRFASSPGLAGAQYRHGRLAPQVPHLTTALDPISYAERVAGDNRYFAGVVDDPHHGTVHLNLVHAPQSLITRLRAAYPDTFVVDNNAPRTWGFVLGLQRATHSSYWKAHGVDIVESWPNQYGSLHVGVTSNVAVAQALFDVKYGPGVVHVSRAEPATPVTDPRRLG
ncbi:MAG TPA: hypothetical protein VGH79_07265 [Gaiellaceae bacterium]|jgi:hypothetical protein